MKTNEYNIKIGILNEETINVDDIIEFTGSKRDALEFINKYYPIYLIRNKFSVPIVIKINDSDWSLFEDNEKIILK